jgi:hypothetical protein
VGGWVGGSKSRFKDCLQQSKINNYEMNLIDTVKNEYILVDLKIRNHSKYS